MKTKFFAIGFLSIGLVLFIESCKSDISNNAIPNQTIETEIQAEELQVQAIQSKENLTNTIPEVPPNPLEKFDLEKATKWTNTAKFIAGIKADDNSSLSDLQNSQNWINHSNFLNSAWSKLESEQLSKVNRWAGLELKKINETSPTVFYPFSGADFLYVNSFFPQGKEYVLVGLEPVGKIPDFKAISASQTNFQLQQIRSSLHAITRWSFFRTNDMKVDMAQKGVLPFIFLFMARANNEILDVEYIGIAQDGNIQKMAKGMIPGVKISFVSQGETNLKTLYYFSTDLSNAGLQKRPEFTKFVKKLQPEITYLKAASYLMQYSTFTEIKDVVLSQTNNLLQDDSGIPVKAFEGENWKLAFYGNYTPPRAPFNREEYQPDLMNIYKTRKQDIKSLDFGIGYNFQINQSNLMLAKKK